MSGAPVTPAEKNEALREVLAKLEEALRLSRELEEREKAEARG